MPIQGTLGDDTITPGFVSPGVTGGPPSLGVDEVSARDGDDLIDGGGGADTLRGANGDDTIRSGDAGSQFFGGAGDDWLLGGAGDDALFGEPGQDLLEGGGGGDQLSGEDGADTLRGGDGDDGLTGEQGDDLLDGGEGIDGADYQNQNSDGVWVSLLDGIAVGLQSGTDMLLGIEVVVTGNGNDTILGAATADRLIGGAGADLVEGGGGGDSLLGDDGDDTIDGGDGDDTIDSGRGNDAIIGGAGIDLLRPFEIAALRIDLKAGRVVSSDGTDTVQGIEQVLGNLNADTIIGGAAAETLVGAEGADVLRGGAGDDSLQGDLGADTLRGGGGQDVLFGGAAADVFMFRRIPESLAAQPDTIIDLAVQDRIDLRRIDADGDPDDGDTAFALVADFTGVAAQLRLRIDGTDGVVEADTDGDGSAELAIILAGVTTIEPQQLLL